MITSHPTFDIIPNDTILWQYMSLTKFLFLIKNKKMHFHRIDNFPDKDEGVLSILDKKSLPFYKDNEEWNKYIDDDRKRYFISCWINHPIEQSLMWYAYGKNGVAIRTTASNMRRAMEIDKEHKYHLIGVNYIDKEEQAAHTSGSRINWLRFVTSKRIFFEMEKEVRIIYHDDDKKYCEHKGFDVDITIEDLIQEIRVSSSLPKYVYNLICQETMEANIKVKPLMSEI